MFPFFPVVFFQRSFPFIPLFLSFFASKSKAIKLPNGKSKMNDKKKVPYPIREAELEA